MPPTPLTNRQKKAIAGFVTTILLAIFGFTTPAHKTSTTNTKSRQTPSKSQTKEIAVDIDPAKLYSVDHVVDGDTIVANVNNQNVTVRLIGINTPETVDPRRPVQCFGKEASNKMKEILSTHGTSTPQVRLQIDPSQGKMDKYGRLLAYVILDNGVSHNGTNLNKYMLSEGYAYEYTYNTPYLYQTEFKQAEYGARIAQKGLWNDSVCPIKEGQPKLKTSPNR